MASAHQHAIHGGPALVEAARVRIEGAGEAWTPLRAAVFRVLAGFEGPASAYDVTERVSREEGRRIAPNSVYRILDLFVSQNLAKRVESRNAFIANSHPGCAHDCIFLVCRACGSTEHVDDDAVAARVRDAARAVGFDPERPVLEVHGVCASCR